ncbi:MAG: histidinol dehydrogenase, partial [Bacteroidales bacterium]|nr:histidinol dehydrogenase [Bacteroidales bacterium]
APGVLCIQRPVPIGKVGLYIPGGSAPLFSTVLMLAVPAVLAGCRERILCTPCRRDGSIAPEVLFAARECGVTRIFRLGGAQAVAAMAYGTESVPKTDKIFGPGNPYVTLAKQLVSGRNTSIDMPAGPSEVMVLADGSTPAAFVASDLLSQAEHGKDSTAVLACTSKAYAEEVLCGLEKQKAVLPRESQLEGALSHSFIVVLDSREELVEFAEAYAPEHLIIAVEDAAGLAGKITAAGSVFIGPWSPESAGDYASGTNHTLPTSAWARSYSGVNMDSFFRKMTLQELTREGLESLAPTIVAMARAEGLEAHAQAVTVRMEGK